MRKLKKGKIGKGYFRVTIFGSARIKKDDFQYKQIVSLSKMLAENGIDIVTGGGPGSMMAANEGHKLGRKKSGKKAKSIGLLINLPKAQKVSKHLDFKREFDKFSRRLDNFMNLSNAFVVAPGGFGTILELFYTIQLIQVKQTCDVPVILLGNMWPELIEWIEKWPLKQGMISKEDFHSLFLAKSSKEAMEMINNAHEEFKKGTKNYCLNYKKYKLFPLKK